MAGMSEQDRKAVGDRVKAARIAAGYDKRSDLAADVTLPRFGEPTIGAVERGERQLFEHEAAELGRLLDVAPEWFYAPQNGRSQLDRIEANQEEMLRLLRLLITTSPSVTARLKSEDLRGIQIGLEDSPPSHGRRRHAS